VERAALEPGGTVSFVTKKPTIETMRHEELMTRLDQIARQLRQLGPSLPG
jgi:hypothetical protein